MAETETHTDRLKSLRKANKTEAAIDEDLESKLDELRTILGGISKPNHEIGRLRHYFRQIQRALRLAWEPLQTMLLFVHDLYTAPLEPLFQLVLPFEALLLRRDQLHQEVEQQVRENERLQLLSLEPDSCEVLKLRDMVEKQDQILQQKKEVPTKFQKWKRDEQPPKAKALPKLEIDGLIAKFPGFDEEFRKYLPDFSESWRQQYLKEQRF